MNLAAIENVIRVVFPLTMMRGEELLPAAFKLREQQGGIEEYISVFRQFAETFNIDLQNFDKGRNLPCCVMNVGEVENIELTIAGHTVVYTVRAVPTATALSHGGIFICIGGLKLEGSGTKAFETLNIGEAAPFHVVAIRRRLVDIAKRRMTTAERLLTESY